MARPGPDGAGRHPRPRERRPRLRPGALPESEAGRLRPPIGDLHRGSDLPHLRWARAPGRLPSLRHRPPPPRGGGSGPLVDWLVDPFQAEFVRNGALAAAAVGVIW